MIAEIASHLPTGRLSNDDLVALYPEWTAEKILEKTGIRSRAIAAAEECASDLAFHAATRLPLARDQVDWLLFCTQTPDYILPTTACVLQHRLGLRPACAALDYNLGCSGYIYGLCLADSLLRAGQAAQVLLLTGDTYTRYIDPNDRSTRAIFGDAGTATLLTKDSPARLRAFVLGTDGSGASQLIIPAGGARQPVPKTTAEPGDDPRRPECLYMNGPEIFNFTLKSVPALVEAVLAKGGVSLGEIDLFVFHQANAFMLEHLRRKIGIPRERFLVCLEDCGNTVSSTIPLALEHTLRTGRLQRGMRVLLVGFGVGYSWGGAILEW